MTALGFYSSVEPTFVFLAKKIFPYGKDPHIFYGIFPYRDFVD